MLITCSYCGKQSDKAAGAVNRANRQSAPLYCDKTCFGLAKRRHKSHDQKISEKAAYDAEYREKNRVMLKAKKAEHYKATADRGKERAYRKANMARHVAYCQRPEYREYKREYDRIYRAKQDYGEYWEAFLLTLDIDAEVKERATRYDIYMERGTINKTQRRKREYEKAVGC